MKIWMVVKSHMNSAMVEIFNNEEEAEELCLQWKEEIKHSGARVYMTYRFIELAS